MKQFIYGKWYDFICKISKQEAREQAAVIFHRIYDEEVEIPKIKHGLKYKLLRKFAWDIVIDQAIDIVYDYN